MPFRIPLEAVANQSFSVQFDNQSYDIELKETLGVMSATISINGVFVISNVRILADSPLIPYKYLIGIGGNFIFTTESDNIAYFTSFGITQFLLYFTADEINNA